MSKLKVSQTFYSFQGEGLRTGHLAAWVRLFGCNLKCPGFFQPNPKDPSTYSNPVNFDPKSIKTLDEFPVVEYGCDTLYAIDPRFKHLRRDMEIHELRDEILSLLPNGEWIHPKTQNSIDLCITGGEPLLQQKAIMQFIDSFSADNRPNVVQFETNLTKAVSQEFLRWAYVEQSSTSFFFNVSPKLYSVSGENYEWSVDNLVSMIQTGTTTLKVVVNETNECWDELDERINKLQKAFEYEDASLCAIYIMPVGATYDQQSNYATIEKITKEAIKRGYHISGRLHVNTLGNAIDA